MSIRIFLTGRVAVEVDGEVVVTERMLRGRQGRLLFAYLVCERTRPVAREELVDVLWPDGPAPSWSSALSALMSRITGALSTGPIEGRGISLSRGMGQYQLRLPTDVWVDIESAASAVDRAEGAVRMGTPDEVRAPATIAWNITRRPFLMGVKGEWAELQRRKLERQRVRALDCISRMWLDEGEPDLAIESAIETTTIDQFRETSYQLLMRAYGDAGNRAEAIKTYHKLRGLLALELGTEPSPETHALYIKMLG